MLVNVLVINDYAHINGGASKVAIYSAIALKKKGYNVTYFAAVGPIDKELEFAEIDTIITRQRDILSNPNKLLACIQGLWNYKAQKIFSNLLESLNPKDTILHFHSWTKALSPTILHIALKKNFKIVITTHDYFLSCPNGGLYDYRFDKICEEFPMTLRCIKKNCDSRAFLHKIWRVCRQLIQNSILKNGLDKINLIVPSNLTNSLITSYFQKISNIHVISNPVLTLKDKPVKAYENDVFVYLGRLAKEKGILLFARAAKILGIKTMFIGDGYLRDRILGAYPNAKITGWISDSEIKETLRSARVLVYPSLCYETQGLAVLEAKAMGIPAVVSDTCAASEYIENESDGLLFRSGDLQDLIDKLKMCLDNSLIERMSKRAYENYWKNPQTIDSYLDSLEQIYFKILER